MNEAIKLAYRLTTFEPKPKLRIILQLLNCLRKMPFGRVESFVRNVSIFLESQMFFQFLVKINWRTTI